jgi:hypothetical protein
MTVETDSGLGVIAMGELRASWREKHICIRCSHNIVCRMSAGLDRNFLVAISQCLVFEPAEGGDDANKESP